MNIEDLTKQYVLFRRSLGAKFIEGERTLKVFVRYVGTAIDITDITRSQTSAFLLYPTSSVTRKWFQRHCVLNGLFRWAIKRNYISSAPLTDIKPRHPEYKKPYIYSKWELRSIFNAAMQYQRRPSKTYPQSVKMILQLTYFLGLRISETLSLKLGDINLEDSIIFIRETKFYKSRHVPFAPQVKQLLSTFLSWRNDKGMPDSSEAYLFLTKRNLPVKRGNIHLAFSKIRDIAGIKRDDGVLMLPRIHDLRHTFAVNRLTQWYREGKDVQMLLPKLSTYMGHTHLSHTSVYLTMTDSLLEEANKRFENYVNINENE